jgi:cation:H+ antiporter
LLYLVYILVGLTLLFYGGDLLVTGSVRLANLLQVSPFVIGATIIAFGTSAPELAVAILAALKGNSELAMANVIGSNIANIGLVLGITSMIAPVSIRPSLLKREAPTFVMVSILVVLIVWNLEVSQAEGIFMVGLLGLSIWRSFSHKEEHSEDHKDEVQLFSRKPSVYQVGLIIIGLLMLVVGAKLLVEGGVNVARLLGVSEWFIGITIVAIGTSLPEIISSVIAAKRGHGEMAIGNIFGSNIFNILMVLGLTATIHPLYIKEPIQPDLIIVTAITLVLIAMIKLGNHSLGKLKGLILLVIYCSYMALKGIGAI